MSAELYDPPIEELDRLRAEAADDLLYLLDMLTQDVSPMWIKRSAKGYVTRQAKYTMACVDARLSEVLGTGR